MGDLNTSLLNNTKESDNHLVLANDSDINRIVPYLKSTPFSLESQTSRIKSIQTQSSVSSISLSSNSALLAYSINSSVKVFDLAQESEVLSYEHSSSVNSVTFSPDNIQIASGSSDLSIKVFNIRQKSLQNELKGHTGPINSIVFNRSSNLLASGSSDNSIIIWDLYENSIEGKLTGHTSSVNVICYNKDSDILASASNCIKIWNTDSKTEIMTLANDQTFYYCLDMTPDCSFVAAGNSESLVKVFDLRTRSEIWRIDQFDCFVYSICFGFDNEIIFTACADGKVKAWNLKEKREEAEVLTHEGKVWACAVSKDGNFLVSGGDDCVKVCDLRQDFYLMNKFKLGGYVKHIVFSGCGKFIAASGSDRSVQVFDLVDFRVVKFVRTSYSYIHCVLFDVEGKYIVAVGSSNKISVFSLETKEDFELIVNDDSINLIYFSSDNKYLLSGSNNKKITIWDFSNKTILFELKDNLDKINSFVLTKDNQKIIASFEDKTLKVFSFETKNLISILEVNNDIILKLVLLKNSELLAGISKAGSVLIWNLEKLRLEVKADQSAGLFKDLAFGSGLLGYIENSQAKFWNTNERRFQFSIKNFGSDLSCIGMSNDGKVALGDSDGLVVILDTNKSKFAIKGKEALLNPNQFEVNHQERSLSEFSVAGLILSSIFSSKSAPVLPYFNFLNCLSSSLYKNLSGLGVNFAYTNLEYTGLHLLSALGLTEVIETLSRSYDFVLKTDKLGHCPIFYSIRNQHQRTTDFLIDYLISLVEKNKVFEYFSSYFAIRGDLEVILVNSSQRLSFLFETCLVSEPVLFGKPFDDLPCVIALNTSGSSLSDFATSDNPDDLRPLELKVSLFPVHSCPGSTNSLLLLKSLLKCTNSEIFNTEFIQFIILSRWKSSIHLIYLYTLIIWSNLITLFILTDFNQSNLVYSILFLVLNLFLLIWEFIQILEDKLNYFLDNWNIIDVIRLCLSFTFGILKILDFNNQYLLWATLAVNIVRGITGFRAFDTTRYYIRLIFQSLQNIKSFLMIFIYSNVSFGVLLVACSYQPQISFKSVWADLFNLSIGDIGDLKESQMSLSYFTFLTACVVNVILMLNMLISILGDSFDEFQSKAVVYNYTEMTQVIIEVEQIKSCFSPLDSHSYLHVALPAYRTIDDTWTGRVQDFRRHLNQVSKTIELSNESLQKKFQEISSSIQKSNDQQFNHLSSQLNSLQSSIKKLQNNP